MPMDLAELLVPWLLSAVEDRFASRVSICAEVLWPTSADCSDWRQCLLRTGAYAACPASPRAAAAMDEATHTSRAAMRPGTAAVVKISAGLDCEAVSPLGSVVMPGSESLKPQTTA